MRRAHVVRNSLPRFVLTVWIMSTGVALSQDTAVPSSLTDGSSAILFEISDDFDLSSFEGATISFKHHTAANRAYRVGVSLSGESADNVDRSPTTGWRMSNSTFYGLSLAVQKLYYRNTGATTAIYYGIGPRVHYDKKRSETPFSIAERTNTVAGLGAVLGFEWFVRNEISLLAQYGLGFDYSSSAAEKWDTGRTLRAEYDNWELDAEDVRLGLSVYW